MRKLLLSFLLLSGACYGNPNPNETRPRLDFYETQFNGHSYLYLEKIPHGKDPMPVGFIHSPNCPCNKNPKGQTFCRASLFE